MSTTPQTPAGREPRYTPEVARRTADVLKRLKILDAFRNVPRHLFVPSNVKHLAYADGAQPIGFGQTISQPYIVALMTELARPSRDSRVLEVGTGSGYQAAILGELFGDVYTIEILPELGRRARRTLAEPFFRSRCVLQTPPDPSRWKSGIKLASRGSASVS